MIDFILRPVKSSDAHDFVAILNNKIMLRYLRNLIPHPYTLADGQSFVEICKNADPKKEMNHIIEVDGKVAGIVGLMGKEDVYCKNVELGYWLDVPYWGKGIMTKAARQMCQWGFNNLDIHRIEAHAFSPNIGSCRVLERVGFVLEGVSRQNVYKNGEYLNSNLYALLREDLK